MAGSGAGNRTIVSNAVISSALSSCEKSAYWDAPQNSNSSFLFDDRIISNRGANKTSLPEKKP